MKNKKQGQNNGKNKINNTSRFKKINIRTMNSDQNSIKEQGGGEPKPFTPENVGQNNQNQGVPTPPQNLPKKEGTPFGEQNNNQENPFQNPTEGFKKETESPFPPNNQEAPVDEEVFPPQPKTPEPQVDEGGVKPIGPEKTVSKDKKGNNKLFIGILVAIVVIGILVAGYLFVLPMFSGDENPEGNPAVENQEGVNNEENNPIEGEEVVNNDDDVNVPTVPVEGEENNPVEGENEQPIEEPVEETSGITADSHKSLFSTPADSVVEKIVSPLNLENTKQALKISGTEVALFREIVLTDDSENIIKAGELLNLLAPTSFAEAKSEFQDDPTVYTYTNDSGTWIGLVLQAKSSANLENLKSEIAKIENNTSEITNFFLTETEQASSWKDGSAGDVTSRYLSFGSGNNSFNYGWSGDKLIISTSYQSFKEGVNKL